MRTNVVVVTLLCLALLSLLTPAVHAADYVMRPVDLATVSPAGSAADALPVLAEPTVAERVDLPSSFLFVPYYEVASSKPFGGGPTTLFAIHNVDTNAHVVDIFYIPDPGPVYKETVSLGGNATYSRNVRDVTGLALDNDGFARGYIGAVADVPQGTRVLTGDFIQVDPSQNFATGDRMIEEADLCLHSEIRLIDFGEGTDLHLFINLPQGNDPNTDPESARLLIYDEAGALIKGWDLFSTSHTLFVNTNDLQLPISFGMLDLRFMKSGGGYAYAVYSAQGRFSVGMNNACLD